MCSIANIENLTRGTQPAVTTAPEMVTALRHDELVSIFLTRSCHVQSFNV